MTYTQILIYLIEIVGTIAFAASGAMLAIQKKMDIFGVNVLGITTAVGGGLLRDLILNVTPPDMFRHPSYTIVSIITSTLLFIVIYINERNLDIFHIRLERLILIMDTVGLGIFTVIGVHSAWLRGYGTHHFLMIFVGVITGVGGGMLRDIMSGNMPFVLIKHVYACASLAGAVIYVLLLPINASVAMGTAMAVIVLIRFLAIHFNLNLPRISLK